MPFGGVGTGERRLEAAPSPRGKVRAQPPPQVDRPCRRTAPCPPRRAARRRPAVAGASAQIRSPMRRHCSWRSSSDQRLRDQPARQLGRRIADAEHLRREPLIIGRVAHLVQPCAQPIAKKHLTCLESHPPQSQAILLQSSACDPTPSTRRTPPLGPLLRPDGQRHAHRAERHQRRRDRRSAARGRPPGDRPDASSRTIRPLVREHDRAAARERRRAGGDHDRRHRHHLARQHLRSGRMRCSRSGSTDSASCSGCSATSEIGAAAMMSRATAGLAAGCIVVALPGSEAAVRLAMEKLLHSGARTSGATGHEIGTGGCECSGLGRRDCGPALTWRRQLQPRAPQSRIQHPAPSTLHRLCVRSPRPSRSTKRAAA